MSVGSDGIDVEEIGHAEFAEAEFEAAARELVEKGQETSLVFDFVFAEREYFMDHAATEIRLFAQAGIADDVEIGVAGESEALGESGSASFFDIYQNFSGVIERFTLIGDITITQIDEIRLSNNSIDFSICFNDYN